MRYYVDRDIAVCCKREKPWKKCYTYSSQEKSWNLRKMFVIRGFDSRQPGENVASPLLLDSLIFCSHRHMMSKLMVMRKDANTCLCYSTN